MPQYHQAQSTCTAEAHDDASKRVLRQYADARSRSSLIASTLNPEDALVQSAPWASPIKWHLAHTTWFFEKFVLGSFIKGYQPLDDRYNFLFNSYYNQVGPQHARPQRGLVTRPTLAEVLGYRLAVDQRLMDLLSETSSRYSSSIQHSENGALSDSLLQLIELGIHHEQQHQELMLTDLKHAFWSNPFQPAYAEEIPPATVRSDRVEWISFEPELIRIGHEGQGFAYDNESPNHMVWLEAYSIADRLVTNGEYAEFIAEGGYQRAELWLDKGWTVVRRESWKHPLYWQPTEQGWDEFTLRGLQPLDSSLPVCHLSFFEADAFARWRSLDCEGVRLPTEQEWEHACRSLHATPPRIHSSQEQLDAASNSLRLHAGDPWPVGSGGIQTENSRTFEQTIDPNHPLKSDGQFFGDVWQWTGSQYRPYPRYRAPAGALGEYNGKFMCDQFVLRGSSFATPPGHARLTYRNFFDAATRWQCAGLRLARDTS